MRLSCIIPEEMSDRSMRGIRSSSSNELDYYGFSIFIRRIVILTTVSAWKSRENTKSCSIPTARHSTDKTESTPTVSISQQTSPGTTEPIFFKVVPSLSPCAATRCNPILQHISLPILFHLDSAPLFHGIVVTIVYIPARVAMVLAKVG